MKTTRRTRIPRFRTEPRRIDPWWLGTPASRGAAASGRRPAKPSGRLVPALAIGAATLAASALALRMKARRAERAHPPRGHFVTIDGVRLHYLQRGQGEPVVLLHGNGAMIEDFEISGVIDQAAAHHRVLAFDRPGYGYSARPRRHIWTPQAQADLLARALRRLGVDRAVVVGHSWGTLVALALALDHPELVRGLVLVSGYYFPSPRLDVPILALPGVPVLGDLLRYTILPPIDRLLMPAFARGLFAPAPVSPRFKAEFPVDLALRPWQLRAAGAETALMIPAAAQLSRRYGLLSVPVMILAGTGDKLVKAAQAQRLHEVVAGSTLELIPGIGHMLHHGAPERVVAAIDAVSARAAQAQEAAAAAPPGAAEEAAASPWHSGP